MSHFQELFPVSKMGCGCRVPMRQETGTWEVCSTCWMSLISLFGQVKLLHLFHVQCRSFAGGLLLQLFPLHELFLPHIAFPFLATFSQCGMFLFSFWALFYHLQDVKEAKRNENFLILPIPFLDEPLLILWEILRSNTTETLPAQRSISFTVHCSLFTPKRCLEPVKCKIRRGRVSTGTV